MAIALPDNTLAALLSSASSELDLPVVTGFIQSGQWTVDSDYEFDGKNLIEIAAQNKCISDKSAEAIDLALALVHAGVSVREDTWKRVPGRDDSAPFKLFLRSMGQGAHEQRLAGACRALAMIRPIKPTKDQAEKITEVIGQAGGFHAQLQGLDLISWMALHDFESAGGGCAPRHGTDDDHTARRRIRNRVFGHSQVRREEMSELSRMLLDYRIADLDTNEKAKATGFYYSRQEDILAALEQASVVDAHVAPVIGRRFHDMIHDMCTSPGKYSFKKKTINDRLDDLTEVFVAVAPLAARSDDFYPDFSWIMMERPGMIPRMFTHPHALEKAALCLVAKAMKPHHGEEDALLAAGAALHDCLRQARPDEQMKIASLMQAGLVEKPGDNAPRLPDDRARMVPDFLRKIAVAATMHSHTQLAPTPDRSAPRL